MVVLSGLALWNLIVWYIRNLTEQCGHFFLCLGHCIVKLLGFLLELSHLGLYLLGLVFLSFFH